MPGNFAVVERPVNRDIMNFLLFISDKKAKEAAAVAEQQHIAIAKEQLGIARDELKFQEASLNKKAEQVTSEQQIQRDTLTQKDEQFVQQLKLEYTQLNQESNRLSRLGPFYDAQARQISAVADMTRGQYETWERLLPEERKAYLTAESVLADARAQLYNLTSERDLYKTVIAAKEEDSKREFGILSDLGKIGNISPSAMLLLLDYQNRKASGEQVDPRALGSQMQQAMQADLSDKARMMTPAEVNNDVEDTQKLYPDVLWSPYTVAQRKTEASAGKPVSEYRRVEKSGGKGFFGGEKEPVYAWMTGIDAYNNGLYEVWLRSPRPEDLPAEESQSTGSSKKTRSSKQTKPPETKPNQPIMVFPGDVNISEIMKQAMGSTAQ
jgi:hypothetical protein